MQLKKRFLELEKSRSGEIGKHSGLKIRRWQHLEGSSPSFGTCAIYNLLTSTMTENVPLMQLIQPKRISSLLKRFLDHLNGERPSSHLLSGKSAMHHSKKVPLGIHLLLFILTFFTTTLAGSNGSISRESILSSGLPFSITLILILLSHEMGHYLAARKFGLSATLPFFIPIPHFISLIGTLGAVIKIQSPITSRRQLIFVGMMGPLAGFCVSFIAVTIGLHQSQIMPVPFIPPGAFLFQFGDSLLFRFLTYIIHGPIESGCDVFLSPIAWAGWIGFLITALNLMPFGQLDGGHILYALLGKKQRTVGWLMFVILIILCIIWLYWIVWIFLILFFIKIGHPQISANDILTQKDRILGWFCIMILILTFIPTPVQIIENNSTFPIACAECKQSLEPSGIAIANNKLYVVNDADCTVYKLEIVHENYRAKPEVTIIQKNLCRESDFEGLSIKNNLMYIVDEHKRAILKVDFSGNAEIIDHDILTYAYRKGISFSKDKNAGFEGIAINENGETIYVLNERDPCIIFQLKKEGKKFKTINHFIPKDKHNHPLIDASDLYYENNFLYVIHRQKNSIVKYNSITYNFVDEIDFSSIASSLYFSEKGFGFAEGLAMHSEKIFLVFENSGTPLCNSATIGKHGMLVIFDRPNKF